MRGSQCGSSEAGIDHLASRCLRACQPRFPARGLAPSQPSTDLREGCRCISGRIPFSAFCSRLPACALPAGGTSWRAGLAPHCGSGCGPGWERRGRVGCVSSRGYPSPGFFPPLNARCHLFAASHVSIVACQVPWPGFRGPAEKSRGMMNVDILAFSFCAMLIRSFTWGLRRELAALFVEVV